jgi:hypothetical protein
MIYRWSHELTVPRGRGTTDVPRHAFRRPPGLAVPAACFCLKATAMVLDLHPIGRSSAPSLCLCTGRNASGQMALPWVVAKRAPRRHRRRTPACMREQGAECRKRIPIRTDRLR